MVFYCRIVSYYYFISGNVAGVPTNSELSVHIKDAISTSTAADTKLAARIDGIAAQIDGLVRANAVVSVQLRDLIGYNNNRDRQLEMMCVNGLKKYLLENGWTDIQHLDPFSIFYAEGRRLGSCAAEYDGGVLAKKGGKKHIFLVDSSNTMDVAKVSSCQQRFHRTLEQSAKRIPIIKIAEGHPTQRLLRELRAAGARMHCYVGGTVIDTVAFARAVALDYGVIQQHDNHLVVVRFVSGH